MTISDIQNVIKARLVDVRAVYGKSFYVSVRQYNADGTYDECIAEDNKLFEIHDECISVDIRIKCKYNENYRSREFYFVTKN